MSGKGYILDRLGDYRTPQKQEGIVEYVHGKGFLLKHPETQEYFAIGCGEHQHFHTIEFWKEKVGQLIGNLVLTGRYDKFTNMEFAVIRKPKLHAPNDRKRKRQLSPDQEDVTEAFHKQPRIEELQNKLDTREREVDILLQVNEEMRRELRLLKACSKH